MQPSDLSAADGRAAGGDEVAECLEELIDRRKILPVISGPRRRRRRTRHEEVINAVMKGAWRIVHIAGHGEPPIRPRKPRGVVLSDGSFFGPQEINALRVIPELVFVNCCHLAADDPNNLFKPVNYNRAEFASGVALALIKGGVRCVIAAGWAVDDDAASVFAASFYKALLGGDRFIDAVATAREDARERAAATPGRPTSATAIRTGGSGRRPAMRRAPAPTRWPGIRRASRQPRR